MDDPYDFVLKDLRAQKAQIEQTISLLEALRARPASAKIEPTFLGAAQAAPSQPARLHSGGPLTGLNIVDAVKSVLSRVGQPMSQASLAEACKDGGLILNSVEPQNTIGSVLSRRFQQVGDVVRVSRGTWGLKDWYPDRDFRTKPATDQLVDPFATEPTAMNSAEVVGISSLPSTYTRAGQITALPNAAQMSPYDDDCPTR